MKHLSQKVKSNTGATLLIAIVFMLFCVFVGGSVLAAATVNGSRLKKSVESEQAYLSQRSAALLIAEQLYSTDAVEIDYYPPAEESDFGTVYLVEPAGEIPKLRELAYTCAAEHYCYSDFADPLLITREYTAASVSVGEKGRTQADFSLRLDDPQETLYARMYCDANDTIIVSFFEDGSYTKESDMLHLEMRVARKASPEPEETDTGEAVPKAGIVLEWDPPTVKKGGLES